jgi:hypothetical protein
LTLSLFGLLTLAGSAVGQSPAKSGWFADYQAGQAAARSSGKPLFVVFRCQP